MPSMSLSDAECRITNAVVRTYLLSREATPRLTLVHEFQDTNAVGHLVNSQIIASEDGKQSFLPTILAFHYCGSEEMLRAGKNSVEIVLRSLQRLFHANWENPVHRPADLRNLLQAPDYVPVPNEISLGLYLVRYISGVLIQYQTNDTHTEVTEFRISEDIVNIKDVSQVWDHYVRDNSGHIEHPTKPVRLEEIMPLGKDSRRVFVVHGHDGEAKEAVARFLEKLGLQPVILHEQANKGLTVIEKFEANSDVAFAVVLLTPDDVGKPASEKGKSRRRARQNVVFELGFFFAKLGRGRVCALYRGEVEKPSDVDGVVYVTYDDHDGWKGKLAKEIRESGISIDMSRIF
jgi:hypothetical protein